jgi:hypothetical protein
MKTLFNTTVPHQHQTVKVCPDYGNHNKREFSLQAESLFSVAMYDMDSLGQQQQLQLESLPANTEPASGYRNDNKRKVPHKSESLFSMSMYGMNSLSQHLEQQELEQQLEQQDLEPLPANTEPTFGYRNDNKREISRQPESLLRMEIHDMASLGKHHLNQLEQQQDLEPVPGITQFAFYLVDEYKDLSLREIMSLPDDYLFGEEEENNMSNSPMLNSINVPCGQNVASHAPQDGTERVASVYMESQMQPTMDHIKPNPINEWRVPMMPNSCQSPTQKRPREGHLDHESSLTLNMESRFHNYQAGQWTERFNSLCLYREKHGNCLVPNKYGKDLPLARWVTRQRYQYKLMIEGRSSTITEERVKALDEICFTWDSQGALWGERLEELKKFRSIYMHCNVPSNYRENVQLALWVKCQRSQYKRLMKDKATHMTPQRIRYLEAVGFEWQLRSYRLRFSKQT